MYTLSHISIDWIWTQIHYWDWGKKWFWWPLSHFQGHIATLKLKFWLKKACLHTISWTNGWNFNKLAQMFGHGKEVVRFLWPWPHFQGHYVIKTPKMSIVKSLCSNYLFQQWLDFDQTGIYTSSGSGKEAIRFWWPWPYFQGHYKYSISESCVHIISWINRWN